MRMARRSQKGRELRVPSRRPRKNAKVVLNDEELVVGDKLVNFKCVVAHLNYSFRKNSVRKFIEKRLNGI
jgi:hypothetical protein